MEKKENSKKLVIYSGVLVLALTLLGLLVSYGWAVYVRSENEIVDVTTVNGLKLTYLDCKSSDASTCANLSQDLEVGSSVTKYFEVTNPSAREISFSIYFREVLNTFKNDELVYNLVLENGDTTEEIVRETPVPYAEEKITDKVIASEVIIPANTTQKYRLNVTFLNKNYVQNENNDAVYMIKMGIGDNIKETAAQYLLSKTNDSSITDYNSGNKGEMYTFSHPATSQTEALTDYRYIGNEPNNYIQFNNETWRIIGVFIVEGENGEKEQRIKIIRDESIGNIEWDTNRINEWPTSTLATLLNSGDYYNRSGSYSGNGLTATAKSQIATTKWYLGGSSTYQNLGGPDYYTFERGETTYTTSHSGETRSTNWIANVGLMYPSDYVYTYANGVDNICYTNGYSCESGTPSAGWLFNSSIQWTIVPNSSNSSDAFYVNSSGFVNFSCFVSNSFGVRPSAYLRSDIEIISGTGAENDPYILKA